MRIGQLVEQEKFRTGCFHVEAAVDKKNTGTTKKAASAKQAGSNNGVRNAPGAGLPKGKPPISSNHQKLHGMARTHGFKHVGMSVYQHPSAGLTLSVGPQGWSLSDGSSGADWQDLQAHLEKSFGLPMQDPNAVDPNTGMSMNQMQQPQQQKKPGQSQSGFGGGNGMQGPKQKNPNPFQQSFMGH